VLKAKKASMRRAFRKKGQTAQCKVTLGVPPRALGKTLKGLFAGRVREGRSRNKSWDNAKISFLPKRRLVN